MPLLPDVDIEKEKFNQKEKLVRNLTREHVDDALVQLYELSEGKYTIVRS